MIPSIAELFAALHCGPVRGESGDANALSAITITLPPKTDAAKDATQAVLNTLNNILVIHPHLEYLTVIGDTHAWTTRVVDKINRWLPRSIKVYNRELADGAHNSQARLTTVFLQENPFYISSLSIPFDQIDIEVANAPLNFPSLTELVIRAPHSPPRVQYDGHIPLAFLSSFNTLVAATITIDTDNDIEHILTALQRHPRLTRLAILTSPSSNIIHLSGPDRIKLENAIIRGLEVFIPLKDGHLVIEEHLMCPLLSEALDRLHLKYLDFMPPCSGDHEAEVSRMLYSTL